MQNSPDTPALGAIFFDLDGTLTDPKEGITGCVQYALKQMGAPVPSKDELTWCIGPPLVGSFAKLVGADRAAEGVKWYRERFSTVGLFENALYESIPEVLRQLSERYPLYVASSKPLVFVDQILKHFDLAGFFTRTFGSNLDGSLADKSELLQYALAATGISPQQALMIGDRSHDAVGAKNNGMDFIGALYGYGSAAEFKASGFARWVTSPAELLPKIAGDR